MSVRAFVGVKAPVRFVKDYRTLREQYEPHLSFIRWIPEQNLHLTLNFLGEINEEELPALVGLLEGVVSLQEPFELIIRPKLEAYPSFDHPRVLLFPVESSTEYRRLQKLIRNRLRGSVINVGPKLLRIKPPHVTVGRMKNPSSRIGDKIEKQGVSLTEEVDFQVDKIVLWESKPSSDGTKYVKIQEFFLS